MKRFLSAALFCCCLAAVQLRANAQTDFPTPALSAATIDDPALGGIKAFTVNYPSGWQFEGTVSPALDRGLPSPVFRAYSPDGLTEMRLLPAFTWVVMPKSDSQGLGVPPDHVYLKQMLTAAEFLDKYVRSLGAARVVGPMNVGDAYQRQFDDLIRQMNANGSKFTLTTIKATGDTAALRVEIVNGSFIIEQRIRARVMCNTWTPPVGGRGGDCWARMDVLRAPKGKLDALVDLADTQKLTVAKNDNQWLGAVRAHINAGTEPDRFGQPNQGARMLLRRQAEDLGFVSSDPKTTPRVTIPSVRSETVISDWADFTLDVASHPGSGGIYVRTWSNSDGQRYSTADPKANPNGALPGIWTETMGLDSNPGPS